MDRPERESVMKLSVNGFVCVCLISSTMYRILA